MKFLRIIITFFFLLSVKLSIGQNFTLIELIKLTKISNDEFDTYVIKKGYVFDENIHSEKIWNGISYTFKINGKNNSYISKYLFKDQSLMISFQTPNSKPYLSIKNEIKTLGYELMESGPLDNAYHYKYRKGSFEVVLYSVNIDSVNSGYEITVRNTNKK